MPGSPPAADTLAGVAESAGLAVHQESLVWLPGGMVLGAARRGEQGEEVLVAMAAEPAALTSLDGEVTTSAASAVLVGPRTARNVAALRGLAPWLEPRPLGLACSFGFGDRLGIATTGHIAALRATGAPVAPIFAQQSVRENERTGRTPGQVLDDATWGAFAAGWQDAHGADADHLKTVADVEAWVAEGYTFFTFDPGDQVDAGADELPEAELGSALERLPWQALEDTPRSLLRRYRDRTLELDDRTIAFEGAAVARAAVKYGPAVAHVMSLYRSLRALAGGVVDVEVSVDETATPTSPLQHAYVALELARLGVRWVSLAPRFVGRFEKGVDYAGDLTAFEMDCALHASIARCVGPYKLSLHSGSDKLSVYPALRRSAGELVHVKTSGTSYLEALRTVARLDPALFRQAYGLARERYPVDRASYHVSGRLEATPAADRPADAELPALLDHPGVRQILHVTFGSVLAGLGDRLLDALRRGADAYAEDLELHFVRHLDALGL
jgi:tagaturonate epimerase